VIGRYAKTVGRRPNIRRIRQSFRWRIEAYDLYTEPNSHINLCGYRCSNNIGESTGPVFGAGDFFARFDAAQPWGAIRAAASCN
jgi:hypothetical protein